MKKTLVALSLAALALTACGSNNDSGTATATSTASTSATSSATASATPSGEVTSAEATAEPTTEEPLPEPTMDEAEAAASAANGPDLSLDVLAWQQDNDLPYYAVVAEDGTTRWFDMQGNPTSAQPQWFSTYPFTADERERIAIALDRVGQQIQENIAELEASMEAYDPTTDPAYDSTPAPVESSDPIGGDTSTGQEAPQYGTDNNELTYEQCQALDPNTAMSGQIQYCFITYGL